ncbi:MAG: HlyD family efflux transporter periplasmic adaptor subunit [Treponema sp.]|nr:HlyD family efflux transporter periplasmic adaptor subunit [Treponema sp.]
MKNRALVLEHGNMLHYSRELVQLQIPREINLLYYSILSLVLCIFICLFTLKVNDVVKVNGFVRTQINNSEVKNVISGEIDKIFYQPNQFVNKGEILFSLKDDLFTTLIIDLENEKRNLFEQLNWVNTLLDRIENEKICVQFNDDLLVKTKIDEYQKTLLYLEKQIEIVNYRYEKELNQPKVLYNQTAVDELFFEKSLCQKELEKYKAEFLAELIQKKKAYELEIDKIEQDLIRKSEEYSYLDIKAPVSGFVQELSSLNVGDYVFANQQVLNIIPADSKNFRVELGIPTKDIGEIVPGMKVKYRLSAFPFFEYRGAEGNINGIDSDVRQGNDGRLYYRVYSDIDKTSFTSNKGIEYPLRAGIEVDARIVLEKISVLHFILRKLDFVQ